MSVAVIDSSSRAARRAVLRFRSAGSTARHAGSRSLAHDVQRACPASTRHSPRACRQGACRHVAKAAPRMNVRAAHAAPLRAATDSRDSNLLVMRRRYSRIIGIDGGRRWRCRLVKIGFDSDIEIDPRLPRLAAAIRDHQHPARDSHRSRPVFDV